MSLGARSDEIHPRVFKELVKVISLSLALMFESTWKTRVVSQVLRKVNMVTIFKQGKQGRPVIID